MNKTLLSLATVAALTLVSACQAPNAPQPPSAPNAPGASTAGPASVDANGHVIPQSELGQQAANALAVAREKMAKENISINGDGDININGVHVNSDSKLPKAEITPTGDLLIAGKQIATNDAQRALLMDYRSEIIGIANAGMNMGVQGADLANEAITGIPGLIFGGDEAQKRYEAKMEAKGKEMEAQAHLLCNNLGPMMQTQQKLAAVMPEFKPYANITQGSIDDCMKSDDEVTVRK